MKARRVASAAGLVLAGASIAWLVAASVRSIREAGSLTELLRFDPLLFALSFLLLQVHFVAAAWSWKRVCTVSGAPIGLRDAYAVHFVSLVGKYMPGKIWAAVGKIGLSRKVGVPPAIAGQALVLETLFIVSGSLLVGLTLVPRLSSKMGLDIALSFAVVAFLVAVMLVSAHPSAYRRLLGIVSKIAGREFECGDPGFSSVMRLLPVYLAVFLLQGSAFLLLAGSFGIELPVFPGIALMPTSVGIGFLVLLAPGGIGISEVTLTWLMALLLSGSHAGEADHGQLALVALASRLWLSLAELAAFGVAVIIWGGPRRLAAVLGRRKDAPREE